MDGQDLFDVAEERPNVVRCECAFMRISLLLSGLFKNMLCACVSVCACIKNLIVFTKNYAAMDI